jgi:hypothetical protein
MHKIPSNVEYSVLLHSPIIINFKKLGTINKEVNNDKMHDDFTTQEINDYFSSSEFVSGWFFKKEQNSFTWIHKIELNGLYKKFGGLMNFLLDCALDKVNDEMSVYDYSYGQLTNKLPDIEFTVLKSTRLSLKTEIADVAKGSTWWKTAFLKAKVSHNFDFHFETIEKLLKDHYLISDINLTHQEDCTLVANKIVIFQGYGTSRRSWPMYKSATEIQNSIFLNVNIVSLIQTKDSSSNDDSHLAANEPESEDDESILHDVVICCMSKNVFVEHISNTWTSTHKW